MLLRRWHLFLRPNTVAYVNEIEIERSGKIGTIFQ